MENYKELAESILKINNFFDEISIIDINGYCRYCEIYIPGVYSFTAEEIVGKHIFDVFSSSSLENSEIYKVLTTGEPNIFFEENCVTYKGDVVKGYSSIYPLYKSGKVLGAVVALKFLSSDYKKERIEVMTYESTRNSTQFHYSLENMITKDPYMSLVKEMIQKIAPANSSVLIHGDTGTGKEIAAQAIHYASRRQAKPFIAQNCSAIPANLIESIFFGTEKGSFTGAVTGKGLFELAQGGTLFLDEINSMDFAVQSKILQAIEEKKVRIIGGHDLIPVDVRIVAAVNEDPFEAMKNKKLRTDLFYRLNVNSLYLTPLKERNGDIDYVTQYYIDYYNRMEGRQITGVSEEVKRIFNAYSWPGNLRELRNVIEGAFNLVEESQITVFDIPGYIRNQSVGVFNTKEQNSFDYQEELSYQENLAQMEKLLLEKVMKNYTSKKEVAEFLGISKQALNHKLNKLDLKSV